MGFFDRFRPASKVAANRVRSAVEHGMPQGPHLKASTRGVSPDELDELAATIKDTFIYDCGDHWFYLFIGCSEIGNSFELSLRTAKSGTSPPGWPIEAAALVANNIAGGRQCVIGTTWKLGDLVAPFDGLMALPDFRFGELQPITLFQLVPITEEELEVQGAAKLDLATAISMDGGRMIGS